MNDPYTTILDQYLTWASARDDVRAVLLVGSRARSDHPADAWADMDLITFTRQVDAYFGDPGWIETFGEVWARKSHRTAGQEPEWLVTYSGGVDVDFVFDDARQIARQVNFMYLVVRFPILRRILPEHTIARLDRSRGGAAATLSRGHRILLDKDGMLAKLVSMLGDPPVYHSPSQGEFSACVEGYWLLIERCAKKIARGELAVAHAWMEGLYWSAFLPMIEWHAHAAPGADQDTWHAGRFIEEWADPRVLAALPGVFTGYGDQSERVGLLASIELFDWLAREVAERLNYSYPDLPALRIAKLVKEIITD